MPHVIILFPLKENYFLLLFFKKNYLWVTVVHCPCFPHAPSPHLQGIFSCNILGTWKYQQTM